jgi:hypothetical protein
VETPTSLSTDNKKGPKPKASAESVEQLHERIANLESLVLRMAHNSGTSHSIILKAGLKPFRPGKEDMSNMRKAAITG